VGCQVTVGPMLLGNPKTAVQLTFERKAAGGQQPQSVMVVLQRDFKTKSVLLSARETKALSDRATNKAFLNYNFEGAEEKPSSDSSSSDRRGAPSLNSAG